MAQTSVKSESRTVLPVNRFHKSDSAPNMVFDLNKVSSRELTGTFKLSKNIASLIVEKRKLGRINSFSDLQTVRESSRKDYDKMRRCGIGAGENKFAITNVEPSKRYLYSFKPFSLKVQVENPSKKELSLISIKTMWKGRPFVVERKIRSTESEKGLFEVDFNKRQTLPPGPAAFHVTVFDTEGGQSFFKVTCVVLPSNPLTLSLSPTTYYVTGSYSLRGHYDSGSDCFETYVRITIYNGNSTTVNMSRDVVWEFWDGGVGGTLKESGTHRWSSSISVPANGSWSGTLIFTSPHGSKIYKTYDDKEDMTVNIEMETTGGTSIDDTITARVMAGFGIDIIRVASDDFVGQEYTDLYDAVDVMQSIYEARDITFRGVGRYHIDDSDAGSYQNMNSEDECRDLFADWSADSDGTYIDVFVAHDFVGTGFDGLAGDIPGPRKHSGRESGVVVDKTGYVDGSGVDRLSVDYLGMLIGHEVGHYLGLEHLSESGNLMHSSSGTYDTDLTYDQYKEILDYGWVYIV